MKAFGLSKFLTTLLVMALLAMPAFAATTNPGPGSPGYMVLPLTLDRTITATATPVTFKLPFPATVVGVTAHAKVLDTGDADETYTVDIKEAGTTILSSAVSLAAQDTVYAATLSDTTLADEALVTLVVTLGGTTPSMTDLTVLLVLKRL
ncbi:MAG: hypothetical protein KAT93_06725 [Desulfuromonadales bacterium]|nr:hypothetical protein [Desulfuromonadales bacterium]